MVAMLYTTLLKTVVRTLYGEPPEASGGEGAGLVVVADGVGGLDLCGTALAYVVPEAGLPHEVRIAPWGHGFGRWHADLTKTENLVTKAAAVAADVGAFRAEHPDAPVFLVGKSGGTGVVVKVLEGLPGGAVERAILLAPALSPTYDLTRAFRAV